MLLAKCTPQQLADIKAACEADLLTFTALFFKARMSMEFLVNWHHEKIADALMAVYRGEIQNLLITMPPGGTKTELAVIHFMAWSLARDPYCRFLHLSAADELASLNSSTTKEIVELEEFQALWPMDIRPDSKAKKRWNVEIQGKKSGGVYATSMGGQVTGFRAGYIKPGFSGAIIVDDPLKAEDAWSPAKRNAKNRQMVNTVRSRRANYQTPIILIMQRLHEDDPAGRAMEGAFALDFEHLEIQGVLNEGTPDEQSYWEGKESLESMQALKEKDPYTFSSQIQQRPTPPGGAMIKTDWIQFYDVDAPPQAAHTVLFTMDTGQKTEDQHDWSVITRWVFDGVNVYLTHLLRGKWEAPDLEAQAKSFFMLHRNKRPSPLLLRGAKIEDKASGTGLIQALKRDHDLNWLPIIAMPRSKDKVTRAMAVLSFIRAGQLWVPEKAPWLSAYLGELASFSPALTHKHDDQVDVTIDALEEFLLVGGGWASGMDLS